MAIPTSEVKRELRALARSSALRRNCRRMRREDRNRVLTFDEYIYFVDFFNRFANHPTRPFRKITGNHFKL